MAPTRTKKAKASPTTTTSTHSKTMTTLSPARTPVASPSKRAAAAATVLTASQKQAMIDNLQLEVTERARKLRAQYALQAQSLRTRIEMRINRIPTSLRKVNMGELLERYMQMESTATSDTGIAVMPKHIDQISEPKQKSATAAPPPQQQEASQKPRLKSSKAATAPPSRGTKRTSDAFTTSDKENTTTTSSFCTSTDPGPLPNKKQRRNPSQTNKNPPSRQTTNATTVLSPKSANSRTLPASPFRSPQKPHLSRPTSPLKGPPGSGKVGLVGSSAAVASAATGLLAGMLNQVGDAPAAPAVVGRGGGKTKPSRSTKPTSKTMGPPQAPAPAPVSKARGKKAAAATTVDVHDDGSVRTVSSASTSSTSTTIVKKPSGAGGKVGGGAKIVKAAGKKGVGAASAAAGVEEGGTKGGRRVLRKR